MIADISGTAASAAERPRQPLQRSAQLPYDLHQILSIIKEELCV